MMLGIIWLNLKDVSAHNLQKSLEKDKHVQFYSSDGLLSVSSRSLPKSTKIFFFFPPEKSLTSLPRKLASSVSFLSLSSLSAVNLKSYFSTLSL